MEFIPQSPAKQNYVGDIVITDISDDIDLTNTDSKSDQAVFSPIPRAKTRLLSRSLSVSDISGVDHLKVEFEPPRRNSSGEYDQQFLVQTPPSLQPKSKQPSLASLSSKSIQRIGIEENNNINNSRNNSTTSPVLSPPTNQLSPINLQSQSHLTWKPPSKIVIPVEDTFTALLQTTAERVLNRLKSRQQDLGKNIPAGKKFKKRTHGSLQPVPRKLQPILRDNSKATSYRTDSVNGDKSDVENGSLFNL